MRIADRAPATCWWTARRSANRPGCGAAPEQDIRFFDVEYPIPAGSIADKKKVTVRFEATNGRSTPSVFGVRIVRSDVAR